MLNVRFPIGDFGGNMRYHKLGLYYQFMTTYLEHSLSAERIDCVENKSDTLNECLL